MLDPEIESWRNKISESRKWMSHDPYVVWVLGYNGSKVIVTKMSASLMIEVDEYVKRMDFLDNRTPEGLLELLNREVPLACAATVHLS